MLKMVSRSGVWGRERAQTKVGWEQRKYGVGVSLGSTGSHVHSTSAWTVNKMGCVGVRGRSIGVMQWVDAVPVLHLALGLADGDAKATWV